VVVVVLLRGMGKFVPRAKEGKGRAWGVSLALGRKRGRQARCVCVLACLRQKEAHEGGHEEEADEGVVMVLLWWCGGGKRGFMKKREMLTYTYIHTYTPTTGRQRRRR